MTDTKNKLEALPVRSLFEDASVREKFNAILKENTAGFITSVIDIVSKSEQLQKADRQSLLFAAANAASLDLPVNPNLGFAYILPFYDGKQKKYIAQFQMGYKGFIQLAMRSGEFKTIGAAPIFEGQLISENPLTGYEFDFTKKESDKVIGYAGYFRLVNGFEKTLYMTIEELRSHGLKYSQTYKKGFGLWETAFDSMAQKTVLKLLLSKFAPLSIKMQRAIVTDQAKLNSWEGDSEHIDNKKPTLDENNKEKELDRVNNWIETATSAKELAEVNNYVYESVDQSLIDKYEEKLSTFDIKTK